MDNRYKYIVTINRNYYPSVEYVETIEEALKVRDSWVEEDTEYPDSEYSYKVKVSIAEVIETVEFRSCY
jgi:hypothetical protein